MNILFKEPSVPNFITVTGFPQTIGVESFSREELKPFVKLWERAFWANYNRRKKLQLQK
jgi:hypothetical protein